MGSAPWPPSSCGYRETREPAGDIAGATVAAALERGLIILKTGIYDNVIRILEAIAASASSERTHATIFFEFSSLIDDRFTRTFFCACKDASHHHAIGAGGKRLYHITRVTNPTIGDDRDACFL